MELPRVLRSLASVASGIIKSYSSTPGGWPENWFQRDYQPRISGECSTVHACVDAYAQTLACLDVNHWRYAADGGRTAVRNSSAIRLLRNPNGYQTRSDMVLNLVKQILLDGNGYVVAIRENGSNEISEIHLAPSRGTVGLIDPHEKAIFYGLATNDALSGQISALVPQRDVAHFKLYTPNHPLRGVSPITNCAMSIDLNSTITGHQVAFHRNMGRPGGVLTTDHNLTSKQAQEARAAWDAQAKSVNSGGTAILGSGMRWQALSLSSQDSQLIEAFRMSIEDIARAFRVPLPLVGSYEHATFNNVEQLISLWLSTGLGFLLEHIEQVLDRFFRLPDGEHIELDTDSLLRTDFSGRIEGLARGVLGGIYSPNEARAKEGLAAVEHGYEPRLQAQVVPLSMAEVPVLPSASTAPIDEDSDDEVETAIALSEIRKAMEAA